jgi:hypothetical protein
MTARDDAVTDRESGIQLRCAQPGPSQERLSICLLSIVRIFCIRPTRTLELGSLGQISSIQRVRAVGATSARVDGSPGRSPPPPA